MKNFYHILIITLALLAGTFVFIATVMVPNISGIVDLRKKISTERESLEIAAARVASYRKNAESVSQIQAEISDLETMLLKRGQEVDYFTKLETIAQQHNVKQTLTLGEGSPFIGTIRAFPIDIKIQGSFINFFQYLIDIERQNELLAIKTMSISSAPRDSQQADTLQINMSGLFYVKD